MPIITERLGSEKFNELTKDALMIKVVVDIEKEVLSADCELHVDCADELVRAGSQYKNLWGANIYPTKQNVDFSAVFNIRPHYGNRLMEIQDKEIREKVGVIIKKLLPL